MARNYESLLRVNGGDIDCFLPRRFFNDCHREVREWVNSIVDVFLVMHYQSASCLAIGLVFKNERYVALEFFDGIRLQESLSIPCGVIEPYIISDDINHLPINIEKLCGYLHYKAHGKTKYDDWDNFADSRNKRLTIDFLKDLELLRDKKNSRLFRSFSKILSFGYLITHTSFFQGKIVQSDNPTLLMAEIEEYHVLSPKFRHMTNSVFGMKVFLALLFGSIVVYTGNKKCFKTSNSHLDLWQLKK